MLTSISLYCYKSRYKFLQTTDANFHSWIHHFSFKHLR